VSQKTLTRNWGIVRGIEMKSTIQYIYGLGHRENHELCNLCGSQVRVGAGTGVGWNFPTHQKPVPVGRVAQVGTGFFSGLLHCLRRPQLLRL
jgi:hypothetical protein